MFKGPKSPRWKSKILKCKICGKKYSRKMSFLKKHKSFFCSRKCFGKHKSEIYKKENHPRWNSIERKCKQCGKKFFIKGSHAKKSGVFCSNKCKGKWQILGLLGDKNPAWAGGLSNFPYPLSFSHRLKEAIRDRDNRACRECGKPEKENGKRLDVHHIDGNKNNSNQSNLISLCVKCHRAKTKEIYVRNRYR